MNLLRHILQSGLEGSRFIIRMHNNFETNSYLGIEYEYDKNAADLGKLLYSKRFLNAYSSSDREYLVLQLFYCILQGVKTLHRLKIIHRDLKPENILCNQEFLSIKLIDFGFAKIFQSRDHVEKCSYVGTPAYMAPEVLTQSRANVFKADIYALGIVLY